MEKYFVSYEQGLALKELGFNEPCLGAYDIHKGDEWLLTINVHKLLQRQYSDKSNACLTPLKSQVFDWFREKYDLWFRPDYYDEIREYDYQGSIHRLGKFGSITSLGNHKTVEELESVCID